MLAALTARFTHNSPITEVGKREEERWSRAHATLHLMMSQEVIVPKREKIISRSSSVVTGLSLQMNNMLGGGLASASGRSPIISSTTARLCASFSLKPQSQAASVSEGG